MSDFDLTELLAAAARLQGDWRSGGIDFCFIGGLAVQFWGEPRNTSDVDATVWTEFGNERPTVERLLLELSPRIDNAADFALLNRVLLVRDKQGVNVDIALGAFPFERNMIDRATERTIRDRPLLLCGPSDLIILKAFANRPRDWQDIRGVMIRSGDELDWSLIDREVAMLAQLKEEPEIIERLDGLRRELGN